MEAADDHGETRGAELAREIERARILVRLDADQADKAPAGRANVAHRLLHVDDGVALVAGIDLDIDVGAQHARLRGLCDQRVDAGEAVRRHGRTPPLDHIAVRVVVPGLDQDDLELAVCHRRYSAASMALATGWRTGAPWVFGICAAKTSTKLSFWSAFGGVSASSM
jgi:hypothetical protein